MKICDIILITGLLGVAGPTYALSLGDSRGQAMLGSPLNLVFELQPDADQTADSSCVQAKVWMGDVPLAVSQVRVLPLLTAPGRTASVRVRTDTVVEEPLVTVQLTAGCNSTISRSYTLLSEMPLTAATSSGRPIDIQQMAASDRLTPAPLAVQPVEPVKPRVKAAAPSGQASRPQRVVKPASKPVLTDTPSSGQVTSSELVPAVSSAPAPVAAPTPRLRMEPLDAEHASAGAAASGAAAAGAAAAGAAPSPAPAGSPEQAAAEAIGQGGAEMPVAVDPAAERMLQLEKQFELLQAQSKQDREHMLTLQTQLASARDQGMVGWGGLLLGLLALALAAIAWLLQRLRSERAQARQIWSEAVNQAKAVAAPAVPAEPVLPAAVAPVPPAAAAPVRPAPAASIDALAAPMAAAPATPAAVHSAVAAGLAAAGAAGVLHKAVQAPTGAPRVAAALPSLVSPDASQDVQEQADFYASIGEHEQAIALLRQHLAANHGASPSVYLALLQLLFRLSRVDEFEATRAELETHFNVQVPEFAQFADKGIALSEGYPQVLAQIEAQWPTDAVVPLLLSLARRDPQTQSPRFSLAALDDLLMLYQVAQTTPASMRGQLQGRLQSGESAAPSVDAAPLAIDAGGQDSPFAPPLESAPDAELIDGLTLDLDWGDTPAPKPVEPPKPSLDLDLGEWKLDLPDSQPPEKP